ncbi:MAG: NAD(P)H-quinone oxidoreductase subunit 3, chloroplastic [Acidimicrobiales bacterium]|nr:MAG: NADH-ubiquinone/plastoquinone oxidoreductase chain 3 [Actinomycetota bacterium]MBV6510330.1 NAD(P)H-quinone oxidoreductase subunit 3, chloroplastic [Acidimicrobiales bacterium]RIK07907.1 MAG: NADH-ubiquinone/plastoquinone oxidoreductase chain 3 [Acidobacteriota bacterium]
MGQYLPIFALLVLASLFAAVSFAASRLLNPPHPTPAKTVPYECGIIDAKEPPERFPVKFFLVAMIFIVFDIEIIFLYPFAVVYRSLGLFGLVALAIFAALVFESFVYLISNGALDWGPAKHLRRRSPMVDSLRTADTTVKRVGTDGREAAA